MESKLQIDVNASSREARIFIKHVPSEDLRDSVLGYLIYDACPEVLDSDGRIIPSKRIIDGYCRISVMGNAGSYTAVEIVPIHPMQMLKHIPAIETNAAKFPSLGFIDEAPVKVSPWKPILYTVDMPENKTLVVRTPTDWDGGKQYHYASVIRTTQTLMRFADQTKEYEIGNNIWNDYEWLDQSNFAAPKKSS